MEEILASIRRIISDEVASGRDTAAPRASRAVRDAAEPAFDEAPAEPRTMRRDLPEADRLAAAAVDAEAADISEHAAEPPLSAEIADESSDAAEAAPAPRAAPELPAFVSRSAMNAARAEPTRLTSYPGYAPIGRPPAADPFTSGRRAAAAAGDEPVVAATRPEPTFTPAPRPSLARHASRAAVAAALPDFGPVDAPLPDAPPVGEVQPAEVPDQDAHFAAALLDLDLVEQAVQAELAIMSSEAAEAATASSVATQVMVPEPVAATSDRYEAVPSAAASEPLFLAPTASSPEIADMQVQAKPATVPRAPEATEERRAESRSEPRFFPAPRPAEVPAAEAPNRLVSGTTTTAVSAAFGSLARTVASNSRTVDDLVTEAIRPMLKEWLDENLPALVERLVRAEIERVSRQGQ